MEEEKEKKEKKEYREPRVEKREKLVEVTGGAIIDGPGVPVIS